MSGRVYLRVARLPRALVAAARRCAVSDLYEAIPAKLRERAMMSPRMQGLSAGLRAAGSALTVKAARGDNLAMHRALRLARRGDFLVVAAGGGPGAQWGDLAALDARRVGVAGIAVHGCVRDVDALRAMRFPTWCTAIAPSHPTKVRAGDVNVPVTCDGVRVAPGDLVVADGDGVIVVPAALAADAVARVAGRRAGERRAARRIARGTRLWDLHDLDAAYRDSGMVESDTDWKGRRT